MCPSKWPSRACSLSGCQRNRVCMLQWKQSFGDSIHDRMQRVWHLVVALQRLGAGVVHHEAHIWLVDACGQLSRALWRRRAQPATQMYADYRTRP